MLRDRIAVAATPNAYEAVRDPGVQVQVTEDVSPAIRVHCCAGPYLSTVVCIQASDCAFATVRGHGAIITWGCKLGAGNSSAAQDLLKKGCGGCGNPSFRAGICSIAVLGSSCLWWRQQFGAAAAASSASHPGNQGPTGAGGDNADPVQRCILFCRHPGEQKGCYLG